MLHDVTFGLVHGSGHRGACWNPLVAELSRRGFRSVAVDLPCDRADAGAGDYAEVVTGALREVDGPLVLVGHSLGGLTSRRPSLASRPGLRPGLLSPPGAPTVA